MPTPHLGEIRSEADALLRRGIYADAFPIYDRLREALIADFGPAHPYVAAVIETLAGVMRQRDDRAGARRLFEAAREIYRTADPTRVASIDHVLAHLDPIALEVLDPRPRLVVVRLRDGQTRPVLNDVFVLGRGIERVHMALLDNTVGRVHARILWREGLGWEIEDCASENGTAFEGKRITAHVISNGDVYTLGDERIQCQLSAR